ncbi:MAG TPA: metallophosphoesterase family protein [Planctomycetota bacterium]
MKRSLLSHWFVVAAVAAFAAPVPAQLIAAGATWKYLDDGSDQGTAWRDLVFHDLSWAAGPAQLGYGDGDEATVVSYGGNANNKFTTTYFRHGFDVAAPASVTTLDLGLVRDDGAVVYLNGTEVARSNMPGGAVDYLTFASSTIGGADESAVTWFVIDPALLLPGRNVVAVEIHQRNLTSSDISFDLELTDQGLPELERGPYLQLGTPDSVWVRWRTRNAADSVVRYGAAPGSLNQTASNPALTLNHKVQLTGLQPGTVHYYAFGDASGDLGGDDLEHVFRTAPAVGSERPSRVWVVGDSGTGNANARAVRDGFYAFHGGTDPDLWLLLGDNAYDSGSDLEYQAGLFDMYPGTLRKCVAWPTRGNHETSLPTYEAVFTLPTQGEAGGVPSGTESYYSFDYGNAHFVVLDSEGSLRTAAGPMMTWLRTDLAATTQTWVIAFWHHPPYTKGSHDSDNDADSGGRMRDMREVALPILEDYGVDLVFNGHSHSYERSFLIDGHYGKSSTWDPATMLIDGGDGNPAGGGAYDKTVAPDAGTVYTVAGSSGLTGGGSHDHPVMFTSQNRLGSVVLDLSGERIDVSFLDVNGQVQDTFAVLTREDRLTLTAPALVAGQLATVTVSDAQAGSSVWVGRSITGGGPFFTPWGVADLTPPITSAGPVVADASGIATFTDVVPLVARGRSVWFQALEIRAGGASVWSNSLLAVVQ